MPARNRTKKYTENGFYHIYNRGVEKRVIFTDDQDYAVFLSYIRDYLTPKKEKDLLLRLSDPNISWREKDKINKLLRLKNYYDEVALLAYCLMPNHFHFFLKQKSKNSINQFLHSLETRYTMYFNRRHKRIGPLYQDIYKAVSVDHEEQFVYLSKYIHKQALASQGPALRNDQPSSYPEYIGERKTEWVHQEEILSYFSKTNPGLTYRAFVEESDDFSSMQNKLLEA